MSTKLNSSGIFQRKLSPHHECHISIKTAVEKSIFLRYSSTTTTTARRNIPVEMVVSRIHIDWLDGELLYKKAKIKIEVKVMINCQKCKSTVLKAVAKLAGVDEVKLDAEKGVLTVVGSVDPVCVTTKVRKAGNYAEIMSVGPPKKTESPESPKPCSLAIQQCCKRCQLVGVRYVTYDQGQGCSIL